MLAILIMLVAIGAVAAIVLFRSLSQGSVTDRSACMATCAVAADPESSTWTDGYAGVGSAVPAGSACTESGSWCPSASTVGYRVQAIDIPGLGWLKDQLGNAVVGPVQDVANAIIGTMIGGVLEASSHLVGGFFSQTTFPHVTTQEFIGPNGAYSMVASFSMVLLVGYIFLGVIQGIFSGEPGMAMAKIVRDIPVAVLAVVGWPWLVDHGLILADALSEAVLPARDTATRMLETIAVDNFKPLGGGVVALLMATLMWMTLAAGYVELVVRT
ncbi:hypothetical protein, partial [Candidatus Protofrankia californiensis]|uniref:hypothetical protein n=1 Tax=Candidatus Protofrankia californiensis TaxID=1839754 RepID=UPI0010417375